MGQGRAGGTLGHTWLPPDPALGERRRERPVPSCLPRLPAPRLLPVRRGSGEQERASLGLREGRALLAVFRRAHEP